MAARCAARSRRRSSRLWAPTMATGSASRAAAAVTSFKWNSARSGRGQLTSCNHAAIPFLTGGRECTPCGQSSSESRFDRLGANRVHLALLEGDPK